MPLAATDSSWTPRSPPMFWVLRLAVSFLVPTMKSWGKSPKGECFILGSNLLSAALKGLLELAESIFLRWSSTIMVEAKLIFGMFIVPTVC